MAISWPPGFISALHIDPEDAEKIRELGVDTPEQLLAQIMAAPEAFARYLGAAPAKRVEQALRDMVSSDEPTDPVSPPGHLGVPLSAPPPVDLPTPKFDIGRRDELFDQIQRLKAAHAPAQQIEAAERALEELFERSRG